MHTHIINVHKSILFSKIFKRTSKENQPYNGEYD
jgi:hypothetical protein